MKPIVLFLLGCFLVSTNAWADDDASAAPDKKASVLVQTTGLEKGSLPHVVTAYGEARAGMAGRRTVMAPLSAVVSNVYVRVGDEIAKDAPLVSLVPSPRAAASYEQAQTALRVAKQLVERTQKMVGQHLATEQQLAEAKKSESDAQSMLSALQAEGAAGPKIVRAPFTAVVTALSASPGEIVAEGSALLDLAQPDGLVLEVGVVPAQASAVMPGDKVRITPIDGEAAFSGKILSRGSVISSGNGLVPVDISLPPRKLMPGESAEAAITTGEVNGYVVPHEAILVNDEGKTYVVQASNMVAKKVPVRILAADGDKDVISGELDAAAPLVLAGNHQLDNGMKIRLDQPSGKAAE